MSGLGSGLAAVGGIVGLLNRLLDLFRPDPLKERRDEIGKTHEAVEKGKRGDFSDMDRLP